MGEAAEKVAGEPLDGGDGPRPIDVLIVGGGINGCGTFRDLCAQGVECVLIERDDFCAGASAASSRLMHGGLKYLETGEFGLVRESLLERNRLLANAPHVVSPLPTVVPVRSRLGGIVPSLARFLGLKATLTDRGSLVTRLGLALYDLYGGRQRAMPTHRMLGRRALDARVPGLDGGIVGAGLYYEARISHAERLGLELVLDGEAMRPGSRALNHARIVDAADGVVEFEHEGRRERVRPRAVVNAGGAWIDAVNRDLGRPTALMGGSKGSHLVIDSPDLLAALNGHMVYFGTADGRVSLCYPMRHPAGDRVLIGSTDIPVTDPDAARCGADEVRYMLGAVAEIFPGIGLDEGHVVHRFCGVRPLPRSGKGDDEIGLVTRDHSIAEIELAPGVPLLCLIGGKWTTFRAFAEQATDRVLARIGRARRTGTEAMPIGGGRDYPAGERARADWIARVAADSELAPERVGDLLGRYGTRAAGVAAACRGETMLASLPDHSREEIAHLCATERVGSLADLVLRRTAIAMSGRLSARTVGECGTVAAERLGWSPARRRAEIDAVLALLDDGSPAMAA